MASGKSKKRFVCLIVDDEDLEKMLRAVEDENEEVEEADGPEETEGPTG